jgi:hypothetical protein
MKTESVGADILLEAHQLVTGPRNDTYGNVVDDYSKVIAIFEGLTGITTQPRRRAAVHGVSQDGTTAHEPRPQPTTPRLALLDALGYLGLLNQAYNDLPFPRTVAER